jgi:DNA repair exonuclease SbcCD nuclease subunit
MSKIIQTGDVHLGCANRLQDTLWALRIIDRYAEENQIDTILGLGDFGHDRESMSLEVMCAAYDYFSAAKTAGRNWYWINGNHDMFLKHSWAINSIKPFQSCVTLIDTVKVMVIDGVRFWTLPFIHFETAYMKVLKKIEEQYEEGDVLLTHIGTTGAIKNTCFLLKDWSIVNFQDSKFRQVFTGHFHTHQVVNDNVIYTGSPIPFKADEGDCEHGFIVYDTDTRAWEFVDIFKLGARYFPDETPPPNYYTLTMEMAQDLPEEFFKHNNIRIIQDRDYTDNEKKQIVERLTDAGAVNTRFIVSEVKELELKRVSAGDTKTMFSRWLEADKDNIAKQQLNSDLLLKLNEIITKEGNDQYERSLTSV